MQLPRGRFERFVRGVTIRGIVDELVERKFSGCFSGIFGDMQGELIFDRGEVILAESLNSSGPKALFEIFSNPAGNVTAELSAYNDSQIKLAKEFNPKFSVAVQDYASAMQSLKGSLAPEAKPETVQKPAEVSPPEAEKALSEKKAEENTSEEEEIVFSISDSEIESITRDFKGSARELLKKIHLDHLIENSKSGDRKE